MDHRLTKTERYLLNEIDSCPDKVARLTALRIASRLTWRGFRTVINRMIDRHLIAHTEEFERLTITFGGRRALRGNVRGPAAPSEGECHRGRSRTAPVP